MSEDARPRLVEVSDGFDYRILEDGCRLVLIHDEPAVIITDGATVTTFNDRSTLDQCAGEWLTPMGRATMVARLRLLADLLDNPQPHMHMNGDTQ
jgi:hypothetical protein